MASSYVNGASKNLFKDGASTIQLGDGGRLGFQRIGVPCPGRPPILFLHGTSLDLTMWDPQVRYFGELGFEILLLEFRGHGSSDVPTEDHFNYRDIGEALDILDVEECVVVGLSLGGKAAIDLGLSEWADKVKLLIAMSPGLSGYATSVTKDLAPKIQAVLKRDGEPDLTTATQLWHAHPLFRPGNSMPKISRKLRDMFQRYSWAHFRPSGPKMRSPDETSLQQLYRMRCPTLVLNSEHDLQDFQNIGRIVSTLAPYGAHEIVSDAGHMLNMEQPKRVNRIIRDFLHAHGVRAGHDNDVIPAVLEPLPSMEVIPLRSIPVKDSKNLLDSAVDNQYRRTSMLIFGKLVGNQMASNAGSSRHHFGWSFNFNGLEPGFGNALHTHKEAEIFFAMDTPIKITVNERNQAFVILQPGDFVVVPPYALRSFTNAGSKYGHIGSIVPGEPWVQWSGVLLKRALKSGVAMDEFGTLLDAASAPKVSEEAIEDAPRIREIECTQEMVNAMVHRLEEDWEKEVAITYNATAKQGGLLMIRRRKLQAGSSFREDRPLDKTFFVLGAPNNGGLKARIAGEDFRPVGKFDTIVAPESSGAVEFVNNGGEDATIVSFTSLVDILCST